MEGDWEGKRDLPHGNEDISGVRATLSKVKLHVADGKFKAEDAGVSIEGTVETADKGWILRPKYMLGRPAKEGAGTISVAIVNDKQLSYVNAQGPVPDPLVLSRVESSRGH